MNIAHIGYYFVYSHKIHTVQLIEILFTVYTMTPQGTLDSDKLEIYIKVFTH